jgi:hypothetical protein
MTELCPKCQQAPPRRPWAGRGRVAECVACWRLNRQAHSKAVSRRRSIRLAQARARGPLIVLPREPVCRAHNDDLTAAEIERRYQIALKQIRSRAWTSAQRS